uniref:Uncharacterized protein n=1 Tax=Arundo donax TaxID=35708 RepID=A0A0A8ZBB0_ARUDO
MVLCTEYPIFKILAAKIRFRTIPFFPTKREFQNIPDDDVL